MAEYCHELFKKNGFNLSKKRKDAQKENRIKKKQILYDVQRNGVTDSPFSTSTPYHSKKSCTMNKTLTDRSENLLIVDAENAECTTDLSKSEEKIRRKEAYLKRFVEWKKTKQNNLNKNDKKQPFIPCGKPKRNQLKEAVETKSLAPPGHKFKEPANIAEPVVVETMKRESIYIAVSTPPKKRLQEADARANIVNRLPKNPVSKGISSVPNNHFAIAENNKNSFNNGAIPKKPIKTHTIATNALISKTIPIPTASTSRLCSVNSETSGIIKENISKPTVHSNSVSNVKSTVNVCISKTNPVSMAKDKNIGVDKGAITKRPLTSNSASSAIQKAKALNQKKCVPKKQPERARLAVNLKAKSKVASLPTHNQKLQKVAKTIVTPLELCKSTDKFNFITSTKMKSPKTDSKGVEFAINCELLSPIIKSSEKFKKHKNEISANKPTSAKRAILQPSNYTPAVGIGTRKFNFVIQHELETTTDETIKPSTHTPPASEAKKSIKKITTPSYVKASPHGALLLKDVQRKKFNFLKEVSLNETMNILEATLTDKAVNGDVAETNFSTAINRTPTRKFQSEKWNSKNTPTKLSKEILQSNRNVHGAETNKRNDKLETPDRACNYLSSFVTCSRGKVSARKEREKRDSIYLPSTPSKNLDAANEVKVETPIETRRLREAVLYFRKQLQNEIQRLHELCENWQAYKDNNLDTLEQSGGNEMIDVTIGQTKLLTSKKFMQFSGLIDRCESQSNGTAAPDDGSEKTKLITPIDLEGFWSMLGLQVENIEKRFNNLDRWKANDWRDPDAPTLQEPIKKRLRTKKAAQIKGKPRTNAALVQKMREMRAAMRSAKQAENEASSEQGNESVVKVISPRRLRRSTLTKTESIIRRKSSMLSNSNTPDRICVVVPDRRSRSMAPTVISLPLNVGRASPPLSPSSRNNTKTDDCKELLKHVVLKNERSRRSRSSMCSTKDVEITITTDTTACTSTLSKRDVTPSPPRTPSPVNSNENGYKPILKTSGTARLQARNVSFNVLCSVKKFRKFGNDEEATEYDQVEEVHIDELKQKFENEPNPDLSDETDEENVRTYRLRNRKVVLRPSSEFDIPK